MESDASKMVVAESGSYRLVRYDYEYAEPEYVIEDGMMEIKVFYADGGDDEAIRVFDKTVGSEVRLGL